MGSKLALRVLDTVLDTPPAERAAQLDALCCGDDELRREVEALLATESEVEAFLGVAIVAAREPPQRLGPYRRLDLLGEGGMGAVYRAVREDDFELQVALKVLRPEVRSAAMVERFQTERRILARLEHPGIARILDGGTLADGRPYLVMEYVDGEPLHEYCAGRALGLRERLELFRRVAEAVSFAHRHLIVHRDIKPGNVLVTAGGAPKLLDFGIAKMLGSEAPASVPEQPTVPGTGLMTPRYASPEQLQGALITTATDVYALGLLLYEMLAGSLPCGLADCTLDEVLRRIREDEPEPLGRGADVDAIVAKALRKDPAERYASAQEMADDVERYLRHRPVHARQGGRLYALGKFVRRSPWATLAVVLLIVFSLATTVLWREAVGARRQAEEERLLALREQDRTARAYTFLKDLFRSADPDADRGGRQTVREVLDAGRARLAESFVGEPEQEATLAGTLGDVYRNLGLYDDAVELLQRSVDLRRQLYPEGDLRLAVALNDLGSALYYQRRYPEAEARYRESVELRRRLGTEPAVLAQAINNLASALKQQGNLAAAGELYEEALALRQEEDGPESLAVASSLYSLGALRFTEGNLAAAEPLLRRSLEIYIAAHGEKSTRVASVLHTLGRLLHAQGRLDEAEQVLRRAVGINQELLGDEDARVVAARADLEAVVAASNARPEEASVTGTLGKR